MSDIFADVTKVVDFLQGTVDPNLVYMKLLACENVEDRVSHVIDELSSHLDNVHQPVIDLSSDEDDEDDDDEVVMLCQVGQEEDSRENFEEMFTNWPKSCLQPSSTSVGDNFDETSLQHSPTSGADNCTTISLKPSSVADNCTAISLQSSSVADNCTAISLQPSTSEADNCAKISLQPSTSEADSCTTISLQPSTSEADNFAAISEPSTSGTEYFGVISEPSTIGADYFAAISQPSTSGAEYFAASSPQPSTSEADDFAASSPQPSTSAAANFSESSPQPSTSAAVNFSESILQPSTSATDNFAVRYLQPSTSAANNFYASSLHPLKNGHRDLPKSYLQLHTDSVDNFSMPTSSTSPVAGSSKLLDSGPDSVSSVNGAEIPMESEISTLKDTWIDEEDFELGNHTCSTGLKNGLYSCSESKPTFEDELLDDSVYSSQIEGEDPMIRTLMAEARVLHAQFPGHSFEMIYVCLEQYRDDDDRFQIVLEFLQSNPPVSDSCPMHPNQTHGGHAWDVKSPPKQRIPPEYARSLVEMFPEMDPDYLKELSYEDDPDWMTEIIAHLLEADYPRRVKSEARPPTPVTYPDIESQYQHLLAVLPNADPTYLRQQCETFAGDTESFEQFVSEAIELRNYPTLTDYLKRKEIQELQEKYTKQFNVEEFLEIFPDPQKYFMEEKKISPETYPLAMSYLKKRFVYIRITDIQAVFKKNKCNLIKTCQALKNYRNKMKHKRVQTYDSQAPTKANIPFMQEVAYLENEDLIVEHLAMKKVAKELAYEQAKAAGELQECSCCFADDILRGDMASCEAGHLFCKDCIRRGVETMIGDGKSTFSCFSQCDSEFSLQTLKSILKASLFSNVLHRKEVEEVKAADIPGLETCPFCDFATILGEEDKVFYCRNPECMKNTCRLCKNPDHLPLRCEEVECSDEVQMRTYIENKMTEALLRACWRCGKKFVKEDGCNKMTCPCGALMCYICRKPVRDYSHFNPVGGIEFEKCPLFSDNDELHVSEVTKEASKAKEEVLNKNPGLKLKHDPTLVLPEPAAKQARHCMNCAHGHHGGRGRIRIRHRVIRRGVPMQLDDNDPAPAPGGDGRDLHGGIQMGRPLAAAMGRPLAAAMGGFRLNRRARNRILRRGGARQVQ